MGSWAVLTDFTSGKLTVKGEPNPDLRRYPVAIAVARSSIDRLLGTKTVGERTRILRRLRDEGLLIAPAKGGLLTHKVKAGPPPLPARPGRFYCFACEHPAYVEVAVERFRKDACSRDDTPS